MNEKTVEELSTLRKMLQLAGKALGTADRELDQARTRAELADLLCLENMLEKYKREWGTDLDEELEAITALRQDKERIIYLAEIE